MALDYKSGLARYRRYLQVAAERPLWRASAFVIFSLLLVIVLVLSALRPTLITIAGLLGQLNKQQEIVDQLNLKIQTVQQATSALDSQRPKVPLLDNAYPIESQWAIWTQMISTAASSSAVRLVRLSVGPTQISGKESTKTQDQLRAEKTKMEELVLPSDVQRLPFLVTATGEYLQIRDFIETLEKMKRLAILSEVTINKEKDGGLTLSVEGIVGYSNQLSQIQ